MHLTYTTPGDPTSKIVCGGAGCDVRPTGAEWIAAVKRVGAVPVVIGLHGQRGRRGQHGSGVQREPDNRAARCFSADLRAAGSSATSRTCMAFRQRRTRRPLMPMPTRSRPAIPGSRSAVPRRAGQRLPLRGRGQLPAGDHFQWHVAGRARELQRPVADLWGHGERAVRHGRRRAVAIPLYRRRRWLCREPPAAASG